MNDDSVELAIEVFVENAPRQSGLVGIRICRQGIVQDARGSGKQIQMIPDQARASSVVVGKGMIGSRSTTISSRAPPQTPSCWRLDVRETIEPKGDLVSNLACLRDVPMRFQWSWFW
jgi:hypothetical protein